MLPLIMLALTTMQRICGNIHIRFRFLGNVNDHHSWHNVNRVKGSSSGRRDVVSDADLNFADVCAVFGESRFSMGFVHRSACSASRT